MTEEEWLTCGFSDTMLAFSRGRPGLGRKRPLLAVACCHRVMKWMPEERRPAVEMAEWPAEGPVDEEERMLDRGLAIGERVTPFTPTERCPSRYNATFRSDIRSTRTTVADAKSGSYCFPDPSLQGVGQHPVVARRSSPPSQLPTVPSQDRSNKSPMSDPANSAAEAQQRLIVEQFSRTAIPFSQMAAHSHEESNRLVLETAEIQPDDTVLDVACGPGLITCEIAKVARQVTGIDITPAMIEEAGKRQKAMGLTNMDWQIGDVQPLPFPEASFSAVITRYSFHHFLDPRAVLAEMVRVCKPNGKVTVVDVFTSSPEQAEAYDRVERLRDPSHVRALLLEELTGLFRDARLHEIKTAFYKLEVDLEDLLASSFPNPGDADKVRHLFQEDLSVTRMGVDAYCKEGRIHFFFPIVIVTGMKAEEAM